MENLVDALNTFRGKRVLITGDTGFKGSWLSLWLHQHGAQVFGFALPPESNSHFTALNLSNLIQHENGDVRDFRHLSTFIQQIQPEIIFHLAAQALVITSYADPKETFDTNVGGGINLLEIVRETPSTRALVFITSDKCYLNKEVARGYVESDELGGHDPYSASKAAAELVFASYAQSFFAQRPSFGVASARWMIALAPLHAKSACSGFNRSRLITVASGAQGGGERCVREASRIFQFPVECNAEATLPPRLPNPPVRRTVGLICVSMPSHKGCDCSQDQVC